MIGDEYIKAQIVRSSWLRAKSNGVLALVAAAHVIRNLVQEEKMSWLEACREVADELESGEVPDVRNPDFQKLLYAVEGIFEGTIPDKLTNKATQIGFLGQSFPGYEQCAVVSGLVLYKRKP